MSKSMEIRYLYEVGYSVKEIARELGIRYQFAYNVVRNYVRDKEYEAWMRETEATQVPEEPSLDEEAVTEETDEEAEKREEMVAVGGGGFNKRWNFETQTWETR